MNEVSPQFSSSQAPSQQIDVELLIVPVWQDEPETREICDLDVATQGDIGLARARGEFRGKPYEVFTTRLVSDVWKARRVALVGAGRRAQLDVERLRRVAASAGYWARTRSIESIGMLVRGGLDTFTTAQSIADGLSAAEFDSGAYKKRDEIEGTFPRHVVVIAPGADERRLQSAVNRGRIIGESVNAARQLSNEPGNVLVPREFASKVEAVCTKVGLEVQILDEEQIAGMKMGLLLGVARGSAEPPRLVVIHHDPPGAPIEPVLALVGKGITFDSGGISIKPAEGMDRMKGDMAGGAAVAAAMRAIALLKEPRRVIGIIPMSENMPGGRATRPGDVLTGAGGKTVEIINTDAEGRLILGDALWYAQYLAATHIVDVATLTGAIMVALGRVASGLFGNSDAWAETVRAAADRAGDRVWRLPLFDDYREQLHSEIADLMNSAGRAAGAVTAAWFLREFVDDRPWAHVDIAGTAWAEERKPYQPKGPTGVAVRLLIELGQTEFK